MSLSPSDKLSDVFEGNFYVGSNTHFAESMPIKPHAMVWGALLGACKSHGDLEMGREVAGKLFEIEPHNPGNYILLSNMYSLVRGKRKAKQLDSKSDEEDKEEQTSDEEVSKGIIEADTISNPPKKLKTKTLVGRKPIEVTSSSVAKASRERHAQSQYELRVRSPIKQGINIEQAAPRSQPLRKRPRIVVETQETQATEESQHIALNRCNMQAMIRLMKGFPVTLELKVSLKKTPFWHLINAFIEKKVKSDHCRKFDEVVAKIVESYDGNKRTFRLGNKHVKLEREDVKLIFGISCGNEEINQGYCKKEDVQLAAKWKIKGES
ncbi:hypothetical protein RHMOL_Rhmol02G0131700 [Rhododendron molle]|uniref:Uncharacterized protein n=1 Tax=Rhododendron molle TaxID=49168 RepID=A0ACC0PR78_RHOML|nr:hypothetical protein RHMOL_Rhmol02G0131700 [Rhododendron molle]